MENSLGTIQDWAGKWGNHYFNGASYGSGQAFSLTYDTFAALLAILIIAVFGSLLIIYLILFLVSYDEKIEASKEKEEKLAKQLKQISNFDELRKIREENAKMAQEIKEIHAIVLRNAIITENSSNEPVNIIPIHPSIEAPKALLEREILYCPVCGTKLPPKASFCPECGGKL